MHQRTERQSRRDVSAFSELRIGFRVRTCGRLDARDIWEKDFAPAGTGMTCDAPVRRARLEACMSRAAPGAVTRARLQHEAALPGRSRRARRARPDARASADHGAAANATSKAPELPP
jgi:hypothetical protein